MRHSKFYTIALAAITAVSLTGCGDVVPAQSYQAETTAASTEAASEETTTKALIEVETTEVATEETTEAPTEAPSTESATEAVETADYKTAYLDVINSAEDSDTLKYGLIYFDEDDIPELVLGNEGYWVSMYKYANGEIYTLMDHWGYGAMGNSGYAYVPKMNSVRNYNTDYAGLIRYTGYASNTDNSELEFSTIIEAYHFDDKNGNDIPDEDEPYSEGACKIFLCAVNGHIEITADEAASYDVGEYKYIIPDMTLDEIKAALS